MDWSMTVILFLAIYSVTLTLLYLKKDRNSK